MGDAQNSMDGGDPPPESALNAAETTIAELIELWRAQEDGHRPFTVVDIDGQPIVDVCLAPPGAANVLGELSEGRRVQERLLPRAVPIVHGFEFAGRYHPAAAVGGDYWSVKYYAEQEIVTCKLADVTGHGIGAAILMAAVKFVSGVLFRYSRSPAAVMERTNHSLLAETAPEKMATMVYAWIYPATRRARLVNAGHAPAFHCTADGVVTDIPATGPLLGLMEAEYEEISMELPPGDLLFFCSDGVADAGEPGAFGEERIKEIVRERRADSTDAIADAVMFAARSCCGIPRDDMSLVIVKSVP